jgi:hypothetical protein
MSCCEKEITRRSAKSLRRGVAGNSLFAHSKVRDLNVAIAFQHNIVQFEVPIDYAPGVEEEQTDGDFGGVEPGKFGL